MTLNHNVRLVLLLLGTLWPNRFGTVDGLQQTTDWWGSCIGEIVLRNAVTVKHQLNAYTLSNSAAGNRFGDDLLDRLLPSLMAYNGSSRNGEASSFTFNLAPYERTVNYNQRNLVLILMDDIRQFRQHLPLLVAKNVEQRGYFLLVIIPREDVAKTPESLNNAQEIATTFRRLWDVRIHNVVLAIGSDTSRIDLHVYDAYGPDGCCGCARPKLLSQCLAGKLIVRSVALYDRFKRNLYGCQLRVACFERVPFMKFTNDGEKSLGTVTTKQRLTGIEGDLVQLLATRLNFTVAIVPPTDGRMWGRIYPNGTANGALGLLLTGAVHLTVGGYFPYPKLLSTTTQSHNYYMTDLVLAVPEALAAISPLEQLLKPFHLTIWLLLALELAVGFATLRPGTISLSFWRAFIGESLPSTVNPRRTVARFVLLLWIVHSTLLRECYKGSLVGFLTQPTPLNDIHSLAVLVQAGYRFALTETIYHKVFDESQHRLADGRVQLIKSADGPALLERTIRTGDRLAFACTREEIIKLNERDRTALNYRTSDEKLLTFHFAIYVKRSSPIAGAFDWYIRRVQATGFITHWHREHLDMRFVRPTLADSGQAEVLEVRHLLGSYLLLLAGLLLATVVFTLELIYNRFKRPSSTYNPYPYMHELTRYRDRQTHQNATVKTFVTDSTQGVM